MRASASAPELRTTAPTDDADTATTTTAQNNPAPPGARAPPPMRHVGTAMRPRAHGQPPQRPLPPSAAAGAAGADAAVRTLFAGSQAHQQPQQQPQPTAQAVHPRDPRDRSGPFKVATPPPSSPASPAPAALSTTQPRASPVPSPAIGTARPGPGPGPGRAPPDDPTQALAARQAAAAARASAAVHALPPVELQLKRRTATSIVVYWTTDSPPAPPTDGEEDGGMDAGANPVSALLAAIPAPPVYEVAYRQAHRTKNPTARRGGKHTAHTVEEPAPPPPAPGPQAPWRYVLVTTGHAATVEPLQPNTLYELQCRRKWWSEAFGPAVVIRSGPGAPEAPPGLCIQEITSSSVMIAWQVQGLTRALLRFPLYLDPSQPLSKSLSAVSFGRLSRVAGA